jgi:hypothetical protein
MRILVFLFAFISFVVCPMDLPGLQAAGPQENLWGAAGKGDLTKVKECVERGTSIEARTGPSTIQIGTFEDGQVVFIAPDMLQSDGTVVLNMGQIKIHFGHPKAMTPIHPGGDTALMLGGCRS